MASDMRRARSFEDEKHRYQYTLQQVHSMGLLDDTLRRKINKVNRGLGKLDSDPEENKENAALILEMVAKAADKMRSPMKAGGANLGVAPSAEGQFFDNPEKREVREFAQTDAMTNDLEVLEGMAEAPHGEAALVKETPPTPAEIVEEPGSGELSTLNRFVVETETSIPGVPDGHDEVPKHPDIKNARLMSLWFGGRRNTP